VIVYLTDPVANNNDVEKLKKSLKDARGNGALKTCLSTRRAGKRRPANYAVQPGAAKDEFTGIKDATRDDLLAAHRVPPVLMGVMPITPVASAT
jgi:capsid portal protein